MGASTDRTRRVLARVLAALAVSDIAYRVLIRGALRRSLGIDTRHA